MMDDDVVPTHQTLDSVPLRGISPLVGNSNTIFKRPTSYIMQLVPLLHYQKMVTMWRAAGT